MLLASMDPKGNPLIDIEKQLIAAGAIWIIASQVGVYHEYVSNLFLRQVSQEISALITGASGSAPITGKAFDDVWNTAYVAGLSVFQKLSWDDFGLQGLVVAYWLISLFAIVAGFSIWLASFIFLSLFIAIGPIFVAMAAVPATRGVFQKWVGAIIAAMVLQVFTITLLVLLTKVEVSMIGAIASNGGDNATAQLQLLLGGIALFVVAGLALWQLPGATQSIAGGLAFHTVALSTALTGGGPTGAAAGAVGSGVSSAAGAVSSSIGKARGALSAAPGRSMSSS